MPRTLPFGNLKTCRGPAYVNTDFSIDKNWRMWGEKLRLQFRLDFFKAFNHTNFRADFNNGFNAYINCGAADAGGTCSPCSQTNNIISRFRAAHRAFTPPARTCRTAVARTLEEILKQLTAMGYGCFSSRNGKIAEARSVGFSRKDKCPEGISALFEVGIKSANS